MPGFVETIDARVWVSDSYDGVYFNDFIKTGIANNIKKRIIYNGMTVINNQLVNRKEKKIILYNRVY